MKKQFLVVIFILISVITHAGVITYQNKYTGPELNNSTSNLKIEDDFFDNMVSNPNGWQNNFVNQSVKNRIRLVYIGADKQSNLNTLDWTASVTFDLEVKDETNTVISTLTNQTLSISNNAIVLSGPNPTTNNQSILELGISGYSLEVRNFSFTGFPSNTEDFELIAEIETERYFKLPYETPLVYSNNFGHNEVQIENSDCFNPAQGQTTWDNRLNVYWAYILGAEEYELEWYLNSAENTDQWTTASVTNVSNVAAIDWTRITTTNNDYEINLPFDDGRLFYRVRPVGRFLSDPTKKFFGEWSPVGAYQVFNNESKKNWQYSAAYAEEGKVKEVVSFFDGTGRNRQAVTRSNTENISLITETMYDYEGRPVIQTLPAPNKNRSQNLGFHCGYSLNAGNALLEKKNYDFFQNCNLNAPLLGTNEGASNYYSANNLDKDNGKSQVIPDAEQYPYTQSVLAKDGRVKFQSAPGSKHSITDNGIITDNKFTEYFYATPLQYKLDRLFGNEVGYAAHYKLKAVKDANGQVSLSYLDLSDNVVATSLVGQEPTNLDALAANSGAGNVEADFNNLNNYDATTESYIINSNFLVEVTGDHKFNYSLTPEVVTELCTNTDFGCIYDLEITIFDDCDNKIFDQGVIGGGGISSGSNEVLHTQYITLNTGSTTTGSFNVNFSKLGTYSIKKVLKLNQAALNQAAANYKTIYEANCLTPHNLPVDDEDCLGCIDFCTANPTLCDPLVDCNTPYNGCEMLKEQLIEDMSPGGQYFNDIVWMDQFIFQSRTPLSASPTLAELIAYNNATTGWNNLGFTAGGVTLYSWADVAANWNPIWATTVPVAFTTELGFPINDLVEAHPEYCHYTACLAMEPSLQFDQDFSAQTKLPSAFESASITGLSGLIHLATVVDNMITNDPFFTTLGFASVIDMKEDPSTGVYISINGAGNSLLQDIQATIAANVSNGQVYNNINDVWPIIRAVYLDRKNIWVKKYKESQNCFYLSDYKDGNGTIGVFDNKAESYQSPLYPLITLSSFPFVLNPSAYPYWQSKFNSLSFANVSSSVLADFYHNAYFTGYDIRVPDYQDFFNLVNSGNPDAIAAGFPASMQDFGNNFGDNMPDAGDCELISCQVPLQACFGNQWDEPPHVIYPQSELELVNDSPNNNYWSLRVEHGPSIASLRNELKDPLVLGNTYTLTADVRTQLNPNGQFYGGINGTYFDQLLMSFTTTPLSFNGHFHTPATPFSYGPVGPHHEIVLDPNSTVTGPVTANTSVVWEPVSITFTATDAHKYLMIYIGLPSYLPVTIGQTLHIRNISIKEVECVSLPPVEFDCFCTQLESAEDVYALDNGYTLPLTATQLTATQLTAFQIHLANEFNINYPSLTVTINANDVAQWMSNCAATVNPNLNLAGDAPSAMSTATLDVPDAIYCKEEDCITQSINIANYYNNLFDDLEVENAVRDYIAQYKAECFGGIFDEDFTVEFADREYQYTLYYYDRAGNLVQTVPPQGIDKMLPAPTQAVDNYRASGTGSPTYPNHKFRTTYKYNTLNQLVEQSTPDGGVTQFWYDGIGRLKASQNEKQANASPLKYSYTGYDAQGRITEVGEIQTIGAPDPFQLDDLNFPAIWSSAGGLNLPTSEVTYTKYDESLNGSIDALFGTEGQQNLRNRVSSTYLKNLSSDVDWQQASHYSYDIHGNVKKLITDNPSQQYYGHQYKTLDYEYDLISGNVNKTSYQKGELDQFYHKYCYDADNRIIEAYTSLDNLIWQNDASYFYNLHGPLARTELGDEKVQGMDYAYTIQGWLKGVNSNSVVNPQTNQQDIGKDGLLGATNPYYASANDVHNNLGRDAFGFSLNYYTGDYAAIASNGNNFLTDINNLGSQPIQLFNGNIGQMATSLTNLTETPLPLQATNYQYDQLNRITGMEAFNGVEDYITAANNEYNTSYAYDANGNLGRLNRKATGNSAMDDLIYFYYDDAGNTFDPLTQAPVGNPTNKLAYVKDQVGNAGFSDLDDQSSNNYTYDEIGNLVIDDEEEIAEIKWTVYGKIESIERISGSLKPDITFKYDASGNRVRKTVIDPTDVDESDWEHTHYQRDASGNVMAVYKQRFTAQNQPNKYRSYYELIEHPIYGSSRIGNETSNINYTSRFTAQINANGEFESIVPNSSSPLPPSTNITYRNYSGKKVYELSNHLGNVLTTVTDRKIAVDAGVFDVNGNQTSSTLDGNLDYYTADVISYSDYYPFGSLMPGRNSVAESYRYGFNGYEKDDEVKSVAGGHISFEDYGYDPRIARRWNMDPLWKSFPYQSPYVYALNNPIKFIDIDGKGPKDGVHTDVTVKLKVTTDKGVQFIVVTKTFYENIRPRQAKGLEERGGNGWYEAVNTNLTEKQVRGLKTADPRVEKVFGADTPPKDNILVGDQNGGSRVTPTNPKGTITVDAIGNDGEVISFGYYDAEGNPVVVESKTVANGAAQIIRKFDVTNGDGGLFVNDNLTPSPNNNSGLSISATTIGRTASERADNPYTGQIPGVDDIQKLFDKSKNKSGTVTDVEVID